jgi:hypothetical protein
MRSRYGRKVSTLFVKHRAGIYRIAGVRDVARLITSYLWKWIYRLGLGKNQVIEWLWSLVPEKERKSSTRRLTAATGVISDEMKLEVARILSRTGMSIGDLARYIIEEMNDPPPGFRWRKDPASGDERLVKHSYKGEEKAIHRGRRFEGQVFVGAWWATRIPSGKANREIQRLLRRNNGGVFFKAKPADYTDYYGYAIVPLGKEEALGYQLKDIAEKVKNEGDGDFRLSAASLDALAERRKVGPEDIITLTGIYKSPKYNWELNLTDILNGRSKDNRINEGVKRVLVEFGKK